MHARTHLCKSQKSIALGVAPHSLPCLRQIQYCTHQVSCPANALLRLPSCHRIITTSCFMGSGDLNSGPYNCMASTLLPSLGLF